MTREEEINQKARELALDWNVGCGNEFYYRLDKLVDIARWADRNQPNTWISVKDRLPEKVNKFLSDEVLVRYLRGGKEYTFVTHYDYEYQTWNIPNVTHWMPIPELS